jgi:hypothetical protein
VKRVKETLGVLRMVKQFGWETRVKEQLDEAREEELKWIFRRKLLNLVNICINYTGEHACCSLARLGADRRSAVVPYGRHLCLLHACREEAALRCDRILRAVWCVLLHTACGACSQDTYRLQIAARVADRADRLHSATYPG